MPNVRKIEKITPIFSFEKFVPVLFYTENEPRWKSIGVIFDLLIFI